MDSAEQWLEDYTKTIKRAQANAAAAGEALRGLGGTATSPRGEVTVEVGANGSLAGIRLTTAARALEADKLADLILTTAQQAQRSVGTQVMEIMTDYLGEGAALDFVRETMPVETDEQPPESDDEFYANPKVIV